MRPSEHQILEILAGGEGKTVEFKRGLQRDDKIARTLAAFANTRGGLLLVGVDDRGRVIGAPRPRETVRRLRQIAAHHVAPSLEVEMLLFQARGRPIVCCSVPLSPVRPHAVVDADGRRVIVIRAGSSNRAAAPAALEKLRLVRASESALGELERSVLEWVAGVSRGRPTCPLAATAAAFAMATGVGRQRAQRTFDELERARLLIGHGLGAQRVYRRA